MPKRPAYRSWNSIMIVGTEAAAKQLPRLLTLPGTRRPREQYRHVLPRLTVVCTLLHQASAGAKDFHGEQHHRSYD